MRGSTRFKCCIAAALLMLSCTAVFGAEFIRGSTVRLVLSDNSVLVGIVIDSDAEKHYIQTRFGVLTVERTWVENTEIVKTPDKWHFCWMFRYNILTTPWKDVYPGGAEWLNFEARRSVFYEKIGVFGAGAEILHTKQVQDGGETVFGYWNATSLQILQGGVFLWGEIPLFSSLYLTLRCGTGMAMTWLKGTDESGEQQGFYPGAYIFAQLDVKVPLGNFFYIEAGFRAQVVPYDKKMAVIAPGFAVGFSF